MNPSQPPSSLSMCSADHRYEDTSQSSCRAKEGNPKDGSAANILKGQVQTVRAPFHGNGVCFLGNKPLSDGSHGPSILKTQRVSRSHPQPDGLARAHDLASGIRTSPVNHVGLLDPEATPYWITDRFRSLPDGMLGMSIRQLFPAP